MGITSSELNEIKQSVELAKVSYDRALGKLQAVEEQLKKEGFNTIQELADAIEKLKQEHEAKSKLLEQEVAKYRVTYEDILQ
jgi:archaellum component FlaC